MFIVKPDPLPESSGKVLSGLQRDLHRIANALPNQLGQLAHEMLHQLNAA